MVKQKDILNRNNNNNKLTTKKKTCKWKRNEKKSVSGGVGAVHLLFLPLPKTQNKIFSFVHLLYFVCFNLDTEKSRLLNRLLQI